MSSSDTQHKKLVIVEDVEGVLLLLAHKFRSEGFKVFTATDGASGLESIQRHRPDLIVTDILMPVMDGIEMMRAVRKYSNVPVVFLSVLSETGFNKSIRGISNVRGYLWKNDLSLEAIVTFVQKIFTFNT